ncbi:MAG: protease family protein [Verrucomicrobiota bacterium]|jgi:membrane protease YdiL (CAAX protease family)
MSLLKRIWSVTWRILVFVLLWAGLSTPLVLPVISKTVPHGGALPLWLRLYIETVSAITILIAAWVMLRFVDRRSFISLGFGNRNLLRDSLIGLAVGLGMMTACAVLLLIFGWATWSASGTFAQSALAMATLAMLINTVTQEVMVRGYAQQTIQSRFGAMNGVIFSALFFLTLHVGAIQNQILPAISLFAAGILLGAAYAVSRNLWLPIALHFGWNVLQGPVLGQPVSGQALDAGSRLLQIAGPPLMTGGKFGIEGGLIAIAITILGTPLVLLIYRQRTKKVGSRTRAIGISRG